MLFKRYLLVSLGIVGVGIAMMIYGTVFDPPTSFFGASQMVGGAGFLLLGWGCRVVPKHLPQRSMSASYVFFGLYFLLMGASFAVGFDHLRKSLAHKTLVAAAAACALVAFIAWLCATAAQASQRNRRS